MSEPQGLIDLFKRLEDRLVPFIERRQELWCSVCRYRDPLIDGGKLHADDCPLLMLNNALEQALIPPGAARQLGQAWVSKVTSGTGPDDSPSVIGPVRVQRDLFMETA